MANVSTMYVNSIAPRDTENLVLGGTSVIANKLSAPNLESAYANFGTLFDDNINMPISDTSSNGITMPIYRNFSDPKNINVTVATNGGYWSHVYTGIYVMHIMYRQASGGDIWTQYAVTKNGSNDVVGVTARMGSEDAHTESFHIMYRVDSTSANYRLQGWCQSGTRYAGNSGGYSGNPGWTSTTTKITNGTAVGRTVDIFIYRVSDL